MYKCIDNQIIYKDILEHLFQVIENSLVFKNIGIILFMIHLDIKIRL